MLKRKWKRVKAAVLAALLICLILGKKFRRAEQ